MVSRTNREDAVEGYCMKCDRRTRHAIRTPPAGREYFECRRCGNRVDEKAFVYDSMDPL